jgi:mannose-6-phosphate isomerase class I
LNSAINFRVINWFTLPKTKHHGEIGSSSWQTLEFPGLRVRVVEYSQNFIDNHWCEKGHIVYCLEGMLICEIKSGEKQYLSKGMTFIVSDKFSSHRITSEEGAKLLIIDGDFLSVKE